MLTWMVYAALVALPVEGEATTSSAPRVSETPSAATGALARVQGRVTDAATGAALADARIYLVGSNLLAISAATGNYTMVDVPPGTHELRVERVGYATVSRQVALTDAAVLETDFALTAVGGAAARPGAAPQASSARISGRVTDPASGAPLADVQVYLVGASIGAITRQTGQYLILNVPAGTYTVRAERIGRTSATRQITLTAGDAVEENFQLVVQPVVDDFHRLGLPRRD